MFGRDMFLNIELLVECVKKIRDNTQCITCDKLISPCVRFSCGHSVCQSCAEQAEECIFCISSNTSAVVDEPQTTRVLNSLRLISAFEDTFKIDVEKRQRVSDFLKLEKQIFPECIQAPNKYSNKRKSVHVSSKKKENKRPIYFEEKTDCAGVVKMRKNQYIQNWLNENESIAQNSPRTPFGDININTPIKIDRKNTTKLNKTNTHINSKKSTRKKTSQSKLRNRSLLLNEIEKPITKIKDFNNIKERKNEEEKHEKHNWKHKCDRNESGIVLDDEPIVIDDSGLDTTIDKDKEAWLAVLEAAKRDECDEKQILSETALHPIEMKSNLKNTDDLTFNNTPNPINHVDDMINMSRNVLFYKKGSLSETCKLCNYDNYKNKVNLDCNMTENNDVSIVINNSDFTTTIKFTQCVPNKHKTLHKNSVEIQTDTPEMKYVTNEHKRKSPIHYETIPNKIIKPNLALQSLDVFDSDKVYEYTNVEKQICNEYNRKSIYSESQKHSTHVVVEDSDTDSNVSHGNIHEVKAQVHVTNAPETMQPDILTTISKNQYQKRSKRTLRGQTPNSSNSSDKENVDPNRIKQQKIGKKLKCKKKLR